MLRILFLSLFVFAQLVSKAQNGAKVDYTLAGAPLPFIKMAILDTILDEHKAQPTGKKKKNEDEDHTVVLGHFTSKDLTNTGNVLVMIFDPTCDHCEAQTALFEQNMDLFNNSRLVLMTAPVYKEGLPGFMTRLHTVDYPKMTVGCDDTDFVPKIFQYEQLPQISIYSKQHTLIRTFNGNTPIDSLKRYLD